jgi:hypothetical protein
MTSLSDKLKALGVRTGTEHLSAPKKDEAHDIGSVLPGATLVPTSLGETFIYEEHFTAGHRHGHTPIRIEASLDVMSAWAADVRLRELPI